MQERFRPARPTHDGLLKPSLGYITSWLVPPPPPLESRRRRCRIQFTEEHEACATSRRRTSRVTFPLAVKMVGFLPGSDDWTDVVTYKLAKAVINGLPYPPFPAPQPQPDPQAVKVPVVVDDEPFKTFAFVDLPSRSRRDRKRWTRHSGSIVLKDGTRTTISYGTYGDYGIEY